MTEPPRRDKRYAASHELLVRCESWQDFVQLYASDVSQGGMFIVSETPLPLFTEIQVQLRLPEGHDIVLKASVVHVIDAAQAARDNARPGVGVHFIDLDRTQKLQLQQLIDFARWEGASGQPSATFASRMFQHSHSVQAGQTTETGTKERPSTAGLPPATFAGTSSRATGAASLRPGMVVPAGGSLQPAASTGARQTGERSLPPRPRAEAGAAAAGRPAGKSSKPGAQPASKTGDSLDPLRRTGSDGELETARRTAKEGELGAVAPEAAAGAPAAAGKAANPAKLKLGVTHLAHKRFPLALKTFEEVLAESPNDRLAQQWVHLAHARMLLAKDETDAAMERYKKVLEIDESHQEARKFVREHSTAKRMNALPFGRYFVKKP
jgi:uncharacterized protein (TIGR02266 family)